MFPIIPHFSRQGLRKELATNHAQCKPIAKFQSCCNIQISILDYSDFNSAKRHTFHIIMAHTTYNVYAGIRIPH